MTWGRASEDFIRLLLEQHGLCTKQLLQLVSDLRSLQQSEVIVSRLDSIENTYRDVLVTLQHLRATVPTKPASRST